MRRVAIAELQPGMVVARDVADGKGGLLLRRGVSLSPAYIRALKERGFAWVYISDEATDLLVVEESVAAYLSNSCPVILRTLQKVIAWSYGRGSASAGSQTDDTTSEAVLAQDVEAIACLLGQVLSANVVTALARMAAFDQTLLFHGLAVAVVAAHFAIRLGFDEGSLRSLVTGCLLHDCGKTLIGEHICLLPVLSEEQLAELRRHPLLGLQMARELGIDDQHTIAIIGQHHERQDGLGYPRNLRGNNRVNSQQQSGRIALAAEIAAIADSYSMLTTNTFRESSLTEEQLALSMQRLAGTMLNKQLVNLFLDGRRSVPLGVSVYVQGGRYAGCRGVVVRRSLVNPGQVVVRLMQGNGGTWMQPLELDMGEEPEACLAAVLE